MRRRNQGKNPLTGVPRQSQTLSDRALQTGLLYNYLEYVSPTDVDGIKRAYVSVKDDSIEVDPISAKNAMQRIQNSPYGMKPTLVPEYGKPTALLTKFSPKDKLFPRLEAQGTNLLRSALRKIVDEV